MDIIVRRGLAEALALAGEHRNMLAGYVLLGVIVPFLLLSSEPIFSLRTLMAIAADPWTYRVGGSVAGPLYLLGIVAVIVAGAMLAAWNGLLAEMREGYISEIMYGMVAGVAYLLANVALSIGFGLITTLPFFLLARETLTDGGGPALAVAIVIYRVIVTLVGSWVGARLCLAGAIMGDRGTLEPVSCFAKSWRQTRSAQWRLFGFYLLYGTLFGVAGAAWFILHSAVIMSNAPGGLLETLMSFGWLLLFALYFLGQILIPAGLYRSSTPSVAVAEVFA
jgi:hypothetical protein